MVAIPRAPIVAGGVTCVTSVIRMLIGYGGYVAWEETGVIKWRAGW
jgi:hypothetical protein